jgi:hypothetical protein
METESFPKQQAKAPLWAHAMSVKRTNLILGTRL